MQRKATHVYSSSQNPPARNMPLYAAFKNGQFYELPVEDKPCLTLTPAGRAEIVDAEAVPLTGLLKQRLDEFRAARQHREQAIGKELIKALDAEEKAALLLAWTLDQDAEV